MRRRIFTAAPVIRYRICMSLEKKRERHFFYIGPFLQMIFSYLSLVQDMTTSSRAFKIREISVDMLIHRALESLR